MKMKQIFVSLVLLVVYSLAQSSDGQSVCKNYNPKVCACELADGSGTIDLTKLAEQTANKP